MVRVRVGDDMRANPAIRDLPKNAPSRRRRACINEDILDEVNIHRVWRESGELVDTLSEFAHHASNPSDWTRNNGAESPSSMASRWFFMRL